MNPLAQLKDIHAAPDPGIWPLAPGWWLLMVLFASLIIAIVLVVKRYRHWRRRQAIINMFESVLTEYQNQGDATNMAAQLHRLIRQLMLANGEHQQLGLSGDAFLDYLDQSNDDQSFAKGIGRVLLDAPYQRQSAFDAAAPHTVVMQWVKQQVRG